MCNNLDKHRYVAYAHPAIIEILPRDMQEPIFLCEKCAKRETPREDWNYVKRNLRKKPGDKK